jgi:hypothetical protein
MASKEDFKEFYEPADGACETEEDLVSASYCPNCPGVHLEINESDWSAMLTLDSDTARRLANELLLAADQCSPEDKRQIH